MKTIRQGVKQSTKILLAFVIGQAIQVVFHAVSFAYWESQRIPFCIAAGVIITAAVFMGVRIAARETAQSIPRTYTYYAEEEAEK